MSQGKTVRRLWMSRPASNSDTGEKNHFPSCRGEKGRKRSAEEEPEKQLQTQRRCQKLRTVWSEKASSQNLGGAKCTSDRSDLKKKGKKAATSAFPDVSQRTCERFTRQQEEQSLAVRPARTASAALRFWGPGKGGGEGGVRNKECARQAIRSDCWRINPSVQVGGGKPEGSFAKVFSDRRAGPSSRPAAFLKAVLRTFITSCSRHGRTRLTQRPERFQSLNSGQAGNWDCGRSSIWTGCKYTLVLYWWEKRKYFFIYVCFFCFFQASLLNFDSLDIRLSFYECRTQKV